MKKRKPRKLSPQEHALVLADMALAMMLGSKSLKGMRQGGGIMVARIAYETIRPMLIKLAEARGEPHGYFTIPEIERRWAKEGAFGHMKSRQSSRTNAHLPRRDVSNRSSAAGRKPTKTT